MYHSEYTPGHEVLSKSNYNIDSHGSISNTASYLVTNDFPDYAHMFYSPTEHETITSIKYGNFEKGYDNNLKEIQESLNGPPLEFYIPQSFNVVEGVGRQDNTQIVPREAKEKLMDNTNKEALKEIEKAQKEITGRQVIFRETEIDEFLMLRRMIRKREVVVKK
ncbi:MAG: hypothetical protein QF436_00685 [Candidatus Woesearchaeota archaeon]|jgi:hypothetical protein|nr:hypothetical protein [Candidatus Woesearchaeota archaeon]MDP7622615.1 hypothetical protein [Candidatus Woesearchaeota archaeon]HJN57351.1 hypothetical protein [Candidatus Woesearchaeota archaeon]|tara:strand:- start:50585 stop:51076 length:492 start_codon:yes stop_codon:yes gene_type:complete